MVKHLNVREIAFRDIDLLVEYWSAASEEYLLSLGADPKKMPDSNSFKTMLETQIQTPLKQKKSYALIWELEGKQIGHTNVNDINFGNDAFMHLHLWNLGTRLKGLGHQLVKKSLPLYFETLQLKTLFCQPYAENTAPNKTLEKVGFSFVKTYRTIPGYLNFEQEVNLWKMTKEQFLNL